MMASHIILITCLFLTCCGTLNPSGTPRYLQCSPVRSHFAPSASPHVHVHSFTEAHIKFVFGQLILLPEALHYRSITFMALSKFSRVPSSDSDVLSANNISMLMAPFGRCSPYTPYCWSCSM